MNRNTLTAILVVWTALVWTTYVAAADAAGSGTLEGRVLNASSGSYVRNARITIQNSTLETFTDENGDYRLSGVPVGEVAVTAFFTGLVPQVNTVQVTAGATTTKDFSLGRFEQPAEGDPLKLDAFVVATNREFNAQGIAINEQRFAPNIKNVVSTDEFGAIGEANIGEFVKFIPGVAVNYNGGIFADYVSLRGFPAAATGVTMDGAQPASAGTAGVQRQFDLNGMQMLNNIARVEVSKTPTPDLPASMLGGSINMVRKSAFEKARPEFAYSVSATGNSRHLGGSYPTFLREERIFTIRPAVDFGYVLPLSKTLGFTLSGAFNERFLVFDNSTATWDLVRLIQTNYNLASSSQRRKAYSWGATADWKVNENGVLSGSVNYAGSHVLSPRVVFNTALGANPTGDATFAQSNGFVGTVSNVPSTNADRLDQTWFGSVKYRHTGKVWKFDAHGSHSLSTSKGRYVDKRTFLTVTSTLSNVLLRYNDINGAGHPGPGNITGSLASGPVDIWKADDYRLTTTTDTRRSVKATNDNAQLNASRYFEFVVPVHIKSGLYANRERRDSRTPTKTWTFLGRDLIANNADNLVSNYDFMAEEVSTVERAYGLPKARTVSPYKVFDYYLANPNQFSLNEATYRQTLVNTSENLTETITAAYVRGDVKLFQNRLFLVGGIRFERTQDEGYGALNDIRATLQQDANGNLLRDAAGRTIPVTTDATQRAYLQFTERGTHAKGAQDGYYPSLNVTYNITDSILARVAYARTIGRPDFDNIVPGVSVTDPDVALPRITIRNSELRPWTADAYDISLEKYFANNGVASVGLFRKNITDFFGATEFGATAEFLADLGLSDDYLNYSVVSRGNVGDARISGLEFNYRQALSFMPTWARGVQIFANGTFNKLEGDRDADFADFSKKILNWGISLSRERFLVKLNWNTRGDVRKTRVNPSASVPEDTYNWLESRTTLDGSFEIRLHRRISLFGTARNLTNTPVTMVRRSPTTPDYASNSQYIETGAFLSLGLKGTF